MSTTSILGQAILGKMILGSIGSGGTDVAPGAGDKGVAGGSGFVAVYWDKPEVSA